MRTRLRALLLEVGGPTREPTWQTREIRLVMAGQVLAGKGSHEESQGVSRRRQVCSLRPCTATAAKAWEVVGFARAHVMDSSCSSRDFSPWNDDCIASAAHDSLPVNVSCLLRSS